MDIKQTIKRQSLEDIEAQAQRIAGMMDHIRTAMLAPTATKLAPALGSAQLADLCGVDKSKIAYRLTRGDLPAGSIQGNRREWSMGEAQLWSRDFRSEHMRPKGCRRHHHHGGQLQGWRRQNHLRRDPGPRFVDAGSQSPATRSGSPGIGDHPLWRAARCRSRHRTHSDAAFAGDQDDLAYAIRTTYWPSIDLVCAAPLLYGAEFVLPARQAKDPGFEFWRVLDRGLDTLREAYDVIVIDTPPSLSYVTINALMAADGVIMPLPPSALDFASSAQFWDLFSDLCNQLIRSRGKNKSFEFIDVLLSRVEASDAASSVVRQWVLEGYGDKVLPIEIPKTAVAATASAEFGTVYDLPRGSVSSKTFARARDAYDRMCELVEQQIRAVWARQLSENAMLVAGD